MPLPGDLSTVIVTGSFVDAAGLPLRGSATFTPSAVVRDATGKVIVDGPRTYWLSRGSFTSDPLVATDNEGLTPEGWTFDLMVALADAQPQAWSVTIPHTPSPVDASALIAAAVS